MNPMKFFWGLVFAGTGFLLLGVNLGWWKTDVWEVLWYLWPVVIIVVGLRFIINNDKVFMVLALLIVLASGYLLVKEPSFVISNLKGNLKETTESFSESFRPELVKELELKFNLGASKVSFKELGDEESRVSLYRLDAINYGKIDNKKTVTDSKTTVKFSEKVDEPRMLRKINKRNLFAYISTQPDLSLDLNTGASDFGADFSKLKLKKLLFKSGASDIDVKFGNVNDLAEADFNVGASSIEINVPKGSGVLVNFESEDGLNNFNYSNDLKLNKEGHTYKSENYDSAGKKIQIKLAAGISDIRINQY